MTINKSDMNKGNNHCNFCRNRSIHKGLCPYFISEQINAPTIREIEEIKARIDKRLRD